MGTLLDLASLVVVPSGYKEDKIYSVVPTDGSGDLDFTRASSATRVNSAGLIEKVRTNLVLQSEAFNTTWSAVNVSVSANTTANPLDGAVNADTITLTGGTDTKRVQQSLVHTGNFTQSIFLKAGTHQFIQLLVGSDVIPVANFDLVNGTTSASGASSQIISLGNGWFRCSMTYTTTTATDVYLWAVDSLAAGRADSTASTGTFFAFGFQLETGDIATDYIPTTTAAVSVGMTADVPRLDYLGSSCPSLLLEPQRTNELTYSEQFNNAAWTTDGNGAGETKTANYAISPDGYQNADRIQLNRTGGTYSRVRQDYVAAGTHTGSVYLKSNTGSSQKVWMRVDGSTATKITITTSWQRFVLSGSTSAALELFIDNTDAEIATIADFSAWGAQLEAGSYATSYIPTLSTSVTRVADAASKTGISSLIGQTEGTMFVDFDLPTMTGAGGNLIVMSLFNSGVTVATSIDIYDVGILFATHVNVTQQGLIQMNGFTAGRHKVAFGYKANDFVLYVDGVLIGTDTSGTVGAQDSVGLQYSTNQFIGQQYVSQSAIYPVRLSNSELAQLTTL